MVKQQRWISIVLLFVLICLGVFLYRYNLEQSYILKGDTVRDMLTVLRLYEDKKITLIGPPISFGQSGTRELYFGSLHYYLGMAGLLMGNFKVSYAALANTLLMVVAIPAFFLLSACCVTKTWQRLLLTFVFVVGPVTVLHTRLFWNPSPIISLSVFFWLCVYYSYRKKSTSLWSFMAGAIAGIIFNLHYFAALPLFIVPLLRMKQWKSVLLWFMVGLLLTSLPLILFEIRHEWYLTQGIMHHVLSGTYSGNMSLLQRLQRIDLALLIPYGMYEGEFYYGPLIIIPRVVGALCSIGIAVIVLRFRKSFFFLHVSYAVLLAMLLTAFASGESEYFMRYMFAVYPMLLLLMGAAFMHYRTTTVIYIAACLFALMTSIHIIMTPSDSKYGYLSSTTLERASTVVQKEHNQQPYNITENIIGDARATALRYFLERDALYKPMSETQYENLDALFVLTKDIKKAKKEQRWEFTATRGLKKIKQIAFDDDTWLVVYRQ
ncbi:MAG: hypothetical protein NUV52_02075 [Candidatus Roizmanbacteria bacterium]|nr:hypothetical protein [Candidatus Roizmanbacteria bacterium]